MEKAVCPNGIPIEVWKCDDVGVGDCIIRMLSVFEDSLRGLKIIKPVVEVGIPIKIWQSDDVGEGDCLIGMLYMFDRDDLGAA